VADHLGPIAIPDPPVIAAFPITPDYGTGMDIQPPIAIHSFDQAGLKTEQRYLLGAGAKRFRVVKDHLSCTEYDNLKAHWIQAQGTYAQFAYTHPIPGGGAEGYTVRYENPILTFDQLVGFITGDPGVTLLEIPTVVPAYTSTATVTRFPDTALTNSLLAQAQEMVPLITIQARDGSAPMYLSSRRCAVDGTLYLPRLIDWSGIQQTLGESSDCAQFTFGDADDVWSQLVNQVNLYRAFIQFSLFHVNSNYLIKLWGGYARGWQFDSDGHFILPAADGVFELGLGYPMRALSRTCWKVYKGRYCPSTSSFPDCPKSYDACIARGVEKSFGGVVANPQTVHIKDNSTGVFGFGRSAMTSVSIVDDTVYQRPVQEIWSDILMRVNCDVAAGRDESDFYSALGIVGEGPIAGYSANLIQHTLDGQPPHDPLHGGGWRGIVGDDPAGVNDFFGLDQAPWNTVPPNSTYAGGLAFAEIRRTDEKGLQLSAVSDRAMIVTVMGGIGGWAWTAPGNRVWTLGLGNPVWVAVNIYLRALGLRCDQTRAADVPVALMESYFDVDQAIAAAAICDTMVSKLVGTGTEKQFSFRGVLKERKPLKDWLQEVMNCCLGFFTFVNGKLWIGIRINSSVLAGNAYTRANILYKSLQITPLQPRFNWLVGEFGDEEFGFALNTVTVYDMDHASYAGSSSSPEYLSSTINFVGVSSKSQASRIIATRLREEVGGVGPTEQLNARNLVFRTTVLALKTMVGDIISLDHTRLPTGRCEARVQSWTLNPDYSIDITANCTTDDMYDLTVGPKPDDVPADIPPPELLQSITGLAWMPNELNPFPDDPLYPDILERTFALWQDYSITRDGTWSPAIFVEGEICINIFAATVQPRIVSALLVPGGNLDGPMTVYVSATQRMNANNQPVYPSNLVGVWIPAGVTEQAIQLTMIPAAGGWDGFDIWAGVDRRRIAKQYREDHPLPTTYTLLGPLHDMTQGLPEAAARAIQVGAKQVWHAGVAGVLITDVPASNKIQANDFVSSTDPWIGRYLSVLADASDGSVPLWNFTITGFDPATGTLTVFPDCVRAAPEDSVQPGDVMVVRAIAVTATANSVGDYMWANSVFIEQTGNPGFIPGEEKGRLCRILRGKGMGQFRYIYDNDDTTLYVAPDWDTIPDATSVIIVESPDYTYAAQSSQLTSPREDNWVQIRISVDNLADHIAIVGGFLVDDQGRLTDEQFACFREIYIFGQPLGVRILGPGGGPYDALDTDNTLRCDTSASDIVINLMPLYTYHGRTMRIFNDNGPFQAIVNCFPGEHLFDGLDQITLDNPGDMVKITAG
jgi:hypothetical protein